jgi:hypothetical protein
MRTRLTLGMTLLRLVTAWTTALAGRATRIAMVCGRLPCDSTFCLHGLGNILALTSSRHPILFFGTATCGFRRRIISMT